MADTSAARAAVHAAAGAKEDLIRRAVEGEPVTDDEMLAADLEHEKALRLEKLEEAKAAGAYHRAQLAKVDELRKRAAVLEQNYNAGIDRLVALAESVDDKVAEAQEALAAFYEQAGVCQAAYTAATYHNTHELDFGHHRSEVLRDVPPAQQPRVWNIPREGFACPRVLLELSEMWGAGTTSQKRNVVHALSPRTRLDVRRPIVRDNAA